MARTALGGGILIGAIVGATPNATAQNPSANHGCPAGYTAMTLKQWAAAGYTRAPALADNPANGGNGDHIACGHPIGKPEPGGFVLYEFTDNDVPG